VNATPLFGNAGINVITDLDAGVGFAGRVEIIGNQIAGVDGRAIASIIRGAATGVQLDSRILGNVVTTTGTQAFFVQAANATRACARIGDPTGADSAQFNNALAGGYRLVRAAGAVFDVEGAPASVDAALLNGNVQPSTRTIDAGIATTVGSCAAPTLPTLPP
jgi:hypothetical protein